MKTILYKNYAELLDDEVTQKCWDALLKKKVVPTKNQIYEMNSWDQEKHTLRKDMLGDKRFLRHFDDAELTFIREKFNPRHLLGKARDVRRKVKETVELDGTYEKVFFTYLNYKDVKDFVNKKHRLVEEGSIPREVEEIQIQLLEGVAPQKNVLTFLGFYYSYLKDLVLSFTLELTMKNSQEGQTFSVKEIGLHDRKVKDRVECFGEGVFRGQNLYLHVKHDNGTLAYITACSAGYGIDKVDLLAGIYQGISEDKYVFSGECILVREDTSPSEEQILTIKRYLFLNRKVIRVAKNLPSTISDLVGAKGLQPNSLSHIVGNHIVWAYSADRSMIEQSRLWIDDKYKCMLFKEHPDSEKKPRKRVGVITSRGDRGVVKMTFHPKKGANTLNISILKWRPKKNERVYGGVFCNVGLQNGKFAILKESDGTNIESKSLSLEEVKSLCRGSSDYKKMMKILDSK